MPCQNAQVDLFGESGLPGFKQGDLHAVNLEDFDFESWQMPSPSHLERLTQALFTSVEAELQSFSNEPQPTVQPSPSSPVPQTSRAPSLASLYRRPSASPNSSIFEMQWTDQSGGKKSVEFEYDGSLQDLFPGISPGLNLDPTLEQLVSAPAQPQSAAVPLPLSQPQVPVVQQISCPTTSPTLPTSQITQPLPRVPLRKPKPTPAHLLPPAPSVQRQSLGGRPPPPPEVQPFLNLYHVPRNHGRVPDRRGLKDTTVANDFYYSIKELADLWLPTSELSISYSGAEFKPNLRFTTCQLLEYFRCASQRPDGSRRPVLRIQIQPSQYNHRYVRGGASFKCRFADCPDKRGTILKGQIRVCITEFHDEHGDWLNPYHNAGYVHLYCLERSVNLIELFYTLPNVLILPENRKLEHEPPNTTNSRANNPMALNDLELGIFSEWVEEAGERWEDFTQKHPDPRSRPPFLVAESDRLFHRLTKAHLQNPAVQAIQRRRKLEAGGKATAHLDQFVGDVSKHAALIKRMRTEKLQDQGQSSSEPPRKRRRVSPPSCPGPVGSHMVPPAPIGLDYSGDPFGYTGFPNVYTVYPQATSQSPRVDPGPRPQAQSFLPTTFVLLPESQADGLPLIADALATVSPQSQPVVPISPRIAPGPSISNSSVFQLSRDPAPTVVGVVPSPTQGGGRRASVVVFASATDTWSPAGICTGPGTSGRRSSGRPPSRRRSSRLASMASGNLEAALGEWFDLFGDGGTEPGAEVSGRID